MGAREERESAEQNRHALGVCQMENEKLRSAIRDALHLGVSGDTAGAGRVLLGVLLGPLSVPKVVTPVEGGDS